MTELQITVERIEMSFREVLDIQWVKEKKEILDWLTPTEYGSQQSDYLARRQKGTCQWLLGSEEYQTWLGTSKKTLFCPGIPGAGKTILTSIVVEHLEEKFRGDTTIAIAYVYCDFKLQAKQNTESLLASLLKQLTRGRSSLPESIRSLHNKHKDKKTQPSLDEISAALQSVAALYSRVFIIVDALDECQDACRSKFMSQIFSLQDNSAANLFATSRHIREIKEKFDGRSVLLTISARKEDVEEYLDGHMSELPLLDETNQDIPKETREKFKDEVKTNIVQVVNGV